MTYRAPMVTLDICTIVVVACHGRWTASPIASAAISDLFVGRARSDSPRWLYGRCLIVAATCRIDC